MSGQHELKRQMDRLRASGLHSWIETSLWVHDWLETARTVAEEIFPSPTPETVFRIYQLMMSRHRASVVPPPPVMRWPDEEPCDTDHRDDAA